MFPNSSNSLNFLNTSDFADRKTNSELRFGLAKRNHLKMTKNFECTILNTILSVS